MRNDQYPYAHDAHTSYSEGKYIFDGRTSKAKISLLILIGAVPVWWYILKEPFDYADGK